MEGQSLGPGRHPGKAQSTLEIVVAVIPILVFLFCTLNLFLWVNERIVRRQKRYEQGRGGVSTSVIDERGDIQFNIFKDWHKLKKLKPKPR